MSLADEKYFIEIIIVGTCAITIVNEASTNG